MISNRLLVHGFLVLVLSCIPWDLFHPKIWQLMYHCLYTYLCW
jgi:hypothetical protein